MSYKVHTVATAPQAAKETLSLAEKAYGFLPNLLGTMATSPALVKAYMAVNASFEETSFTATERQIVLLATSHENACEYCVAGHSIIAQMQQVPAEIIDALRSNAPIADPKLEALRRFTVAIVNGRGWPSAGDTQAFLAAGYGQAQILEVVLGIGLKTLSNYTNHIAATPLDSAFAQAAWTKVA